MSTSRRVVMSACYYLYICYNASIRRDARNRNQVTGILFQNSANGRARLFAALLPVGIKNLLRLIYCKIICHIDPLVLCSIKNANFDQRSNNIAQGSPIIVRCLCWLRSNSVSKKADTAVLYRHAYDVVTDKLQGFVVWRANDTGVSGCAWKQICAGRCLNT